MASTSQALYRNYTESDTTYNSISWPSTALPNPSVYGWSKEGCTFKEWNTLRNGNGTAYNPGDFTPTEAMVYAIWESCNLTISYKGSIIAGMSSSGTKTLETEGTYCEDDIAFSVQFPTLDTSDATVTTSYMRASKTAYGASGKIIGTIPNFNGSITIT